MTSKNMLRGLWIVAAGACIALGTGSGVASAESNSTDGAAGSPSAQNSQPSAVEAPTPSKGSARDPDSAGPKRADKPSTTVSASTVTVRKKTAPAEPAMETTESAKETAEPAKKTAEPDAKPTKTVARTAPKPVGAADAERSVESTPQSSVTNDVTTVDEATVDVMTVDEATPAIAPQPKLVNDVAQPAVAEALEAAATLSPDPATEVAQEIVSIRSLAAPVAHAPPAGPLVTVIVSVLSALGLLPPTPAVPVAVVGVPPQPVPGTSSIDGVTGVQVGRSDVQIPVGSATYTGAADWYFPTQADGTVQAQGVIWLQHGFLGSKSWYSALAQQLAQQTNSIVVVPNIPSFPFFTCNGCTLSGVPMQQGVAALFIDPNRVSLNASAKAAGYQGVLPDEFTLTGHSAGGGLAAAAGGYYTHAVAPADNDLLGVVMFDGVSSNGTFAGALASLDARSIPVYQIAAPPQSWNANGQTTKDLVTLRPGQFVGAVLANGSHVDSLIGGAPIIDFVSQLVIKRSPPGNTQAVYTLATGWINDMYAGKGPSDPKYGIYGEPDQYIVLGPTAAVVLGPAPVVDLSRQLGTRYEVGSVKQLSSVNTGPESTIIGSAVPVDLANDKLNGRSRKAGRYPERDDLRRVYRQVFLPNRV